MFSPIKSLQFFRPGDSLPIREFKDRLEPAVDAHYPENQRNMPHYDSVSVLLLIWDDDQYDLGCGRDLSRLSDVFSKLSAKNVPVFTNPNPYNPYRNPPGFSSNTQRPVFRHQTQLDFQDPQDFLCRLPLDVLILLDCRYVGETALGGRKELMAACAYESSSRYPGYCSFTTALVRELEHAVLTKRYLTTGMLYAKLVQKALNGSLKSTPVHVDLSHTLRRSIFLLPLHQPPTPVTYPRNIPLSIVLSVQLRERSLDAPQDLTSWITRSKPSCVGRVKFHRYWKSISSILVFEIPVEVWYCFAPHGAIRTISYSIPKNPTPQQSDLSEGCFDHDYVLL
ncbi:hypothetical protein AJ79_08117 [Helicocarpus griseus UAMH5409]|uniref:Uncharacterized protein n=1 Tax=Helicocarpus griseus UAMH5409 TaxID=1447875 RepID=A0A2B7WW03_9EURO|nr:hypothetical protein AJ79_08117 [Helicocarpus griseus UAMH5409]